MALWSKTQEAVLVVLLPKLRFALLLCLNGFIVLAREGIFQLAAKFVDLLMELIEEEGHAARVGRALLRLRLPGKVLDKGCVSGGRRRSGVNVNRWLQHVKTGWDTRRHLQDTRG